MKLKQLVDAFVNAILGPPPVANLETVKLVVGGSAAQVSPMGAGRYGGFGAGMVSYPTGEESYWLQKEDGQNGGWVLKHREGNKSEGRRDEVLGDYDTLEEAVPHLRRVSDALKKRQGGFWGSAGGALYFEDCGESGLAAVERALALKKQAAGAAPQPRL